MVSPGNTAPSLTEGSPESIPGAPGIFYPTGIRNYFRVTPPDDVQGAADALLAKRLGARRVYVLDDGNPYGETLAAGFRTAAAHLGLTVSSSVWRPAAASFTGLAAKVALARPQAIFITGYGPAGALVRALRKRFGPRLPLIAGDGFLPAAPLLQATGRAATGMYISVPLVTTAALTPAGRKLVQAFEAAEPEARVPSGTYLPETLQAAELVVAAIARSDGTRATVLRELRALASHVSGGILLESFGFDAAGDMTPSPVTILRITGGRGERSLAEEYRGSVVARTIDVPLSLLRAS